MGEPVTKAPPYTHTHTHSHALFEKKIKLNEVIDIFKLKVSLLKYEYSAGGPRRSIQI